MSYLHDLYAAEAHEAYLDDPRADDPIPGTDEYCRQTEENGPSAPRVGGWRISSNPYPWSEAA